MDGDTGVGHATDVLETLLAQRVKPQVEHDGWSQPTQVRTV